MVKALGNRQRVKNPRKRDRYTEPRKALRSRAGARQRLQQLSRLQRGSGGD